MDRMIAILYSLMFASILFSKSAAEGMVTCFYSSDVLHSSDLHSSLCTYVSDLSSDPVQNALATNAFDSSNSKFDISTTLNLESSASDISVRETNSILSTHFYSDTSDTTNIELSSSVDLTSLGTEFSSFSPLESTTPTSDIKSTDLETTDTESIEVYSSISTSEISSCSNDDQSNTDPILSTIVETLSASNDNFKSIETSYANIDISESFKTPFASNDNSESIETSFASSDISDSSKSTSASSSQDLTVDTAMIYTPEPSLTHAYDLNTLVVVLDSSELTVSPTLPTSSVQVYRSSSALYEIITPTLGSEFSLLSSFAETSTPETATLGVKSSLVELSNNSIVMISLESSEPSLFLSEITNQGLEITSIELSESSLVDISLQSSTPNLADSDISITRETETPSLKSNSIFSSEISDQVASTESFTSSTELSDFSQTYTNTEILETSSTTESDTSIDQTTINLGLSEFSYYTASASFAYETSTASVSENSHVVLSAELITPSLTLSDTSDFTISTTKGSETRTTTESTESMSPNLISDSSDSTLIISTSSDTNSVALTDSVIAMVSSESVALTVSRSDSLDTITTDFSTSASETVTLTVLGSSVIPFSAQSATPDLASSYTLHSAVSATPALDTNTVVVTESSDVVVSLTPSLTTSQPTSHLEIDSSSTNWITPSATNSNTATTPLTTLSSSATTTSSTVSSTITTPSATLSSTATTPSSTLSSTATTPSATLSSTATTPSSTLSSTATTPSPGDLNTTSAITLTTTSTALPLETEERNVTFEFSLDTNVNITDTLIQNLETQLNKSFTSLMKDLKRVYIYNVSIDPIQRSFKLKADVGFILASENSIQQLTKGLTKYKDENPTLMLGAVNASLADIKVNNVSFSSLIDDCEKAKTISGCKDPCDDLRVKEVCRKPDNQDDLIIGLAVGIPLFVLTSLFIILLVCIYMRRKRKDQYMDEKDMPDVYMGNLFAPAFAKQNTRYPNGEYDKISNGSNNGSYSSKKKVHRTTAADEESPWYNSLQHQPKSGFKGNFSWDFLYSGETFKIQRPKLNALSTDL